MEVAKKSHLWTTADVSSWLCFIHLSNYIPAFGRFCIMIEKAAIDGSCLRDLSLDDLTK